MAVRPRCGRPSFAGPLVPSDWGLRVVGEGAETGGVCGSIVASAGGKCSSSCHESDAGARYCRKQKRESEKNTINRSMPATFQREGCVRPRTKSIGRRVHLCTGIVTCSRANAVHVKGAQRSAKISTSRRKAPYLDVLIVHPGMRAVEVEQNLLPVLPFFCQVQLSARVPLALPSRAHERPRCNLVGAAKGWEACANMVIRGRQVRKWL